jgi:hypothetical protein
MENSLTIKPQRLKYLYSSAGFTFMLSILLILSSTLIFKNITLAYGGITGFWLGSLLLWIYDEKTQYKRFTLVITENYIQIPYFGGDARLPSSEALDKARTLTYKSKSTLNNWLGFTFWFANGERCLINKLLYDPSQIKIILEKLGYFVALDGTRSIETTKRRTHGKQ